MSNFRAIATVTAVIRDLLNGVKVDVNTATIKTVPPDTLKTPSEDTLNLYLYQVTVNNAYRNADLPIRSQDGKTIMAKPQIALDLHYLLTAYANSDELKAQLMLASAMTILNDNAVINRSKIAEVVTNRNGSAENDAVMGSNLADQLEAIKLSPQALTVEELTKLWSSFFQASYRISVAYQATVVLLESKLEPKPSLPVSKRQLRVFPIRQPIINSLEPQILEYSPAATLTVRGQNLLSDKVTIRIGGADIEIADKKLISDTQITANIPADSTAGIKAVQVAQQFLFDAKDSGHLGYESNVAAFVLAPQITSVTPNTLKQGDNLTVNFQPAVTPKQKVTVLIGDYVILVTLPPKDSTTYPLQTILVQVPSAILPGAYKVRLRVDGADSLPKDDPSQVVQVTSGP